jgi:hypothetical protein
MIAAYKELACTNRYAADWRAINPRIASRHLRQPTSCVAGDKIEN